MREKYDQIYNSLIQGQKIQAVEQVEQLGMAGLLGFINYVMIDLNQPDMASQFIQIYMLKRCLTRNHLLAENYYFRQLQRISNDAEYIKVKVNSDKNNTNWLNVNRESIEILIDFFMRLDKS